MTHEEVKKAGTAAIYLQGGLSEKEREEFEEHLFGCPECSGIVQADLILKTRGEVGQTEEAVEEDDEEENGGPALGSILLDWAAVHPQISAALLVVLSFAAVLAGYQNAFLIPELRRQNAQLSEPRSLTPLRLFSTFRSDTQTILLPRGCQDVSLWLELDPGNDFAAYWSELVGESKPPIEVSYKAPQNFELHMLVPCSDLPSGNYILKLYGKREGERVLIDTIRFQARQG